MGDRDPAARAGEQQSGDVAERGRVAYVAGADAVDLGRADVRTRVDEGGHLADGTALDVEQDDGDLDDAAGAR